MRPVPFALAALLAAPGAALAAQNEVSLELGSFASPDPDWELFSESGHLPTQGLRLGWALHDRIALVGGWHRGARGMTLGDEAGSQSDFVAAFCAHTLGVGAKADWPLASWFAPYATAQATGLLGTVRLDDDPEDDDNLNQLSHTAFAPGAMATAGLEFRLPLREDALAAATSFELGYAWFAPLSYDALGSLAFRGLVLRWGLGARF